MLFVTVYGPELDAIYCYVRKYTQRVGLVSREQLYSAFLPQTLLTHKGQTKNIEDAIHYLKAAGLIDGDKAYSSLPNTDTDLPFATILLHRFRQLESHSSQIPLLDLLYITLLEQLYIAPNQLWISDLHVAANQLPLAQQVGGISQEKIGAWKRVMEFLGIGYRMGSGFYCLYRPELVDTIARRWNTTQGTLQEFFEEHLQSWIPSLTARGEVALSVSYTLEMLEHNEYIRLLPKQDSPARPYFGARCLRGIELL